MISTEHLPITIRAGRAILNADLYFPPDPVVGIVAFAHGSGSSRHSSRNKLVASHLHDHHLATLLLDLLTHEEEQLDSVTAQHRFDIPLLADRMTTAVDYLIHDPHTRDLPVGLFGASTGAAAALITASARPDLVRAVVSRGGRPDLAGDSLPAVRCPTLLIVGGDDLPTLELNERAIPLLKSALKDLLVIPHATHLFPEPGALEQVAALAAHWFEHHLPPHTRT